MLFVNLQKTEKRSYAKQIYREIKGKILRGDLRDGAALPSTREDSAIITLIP